MGKDGRRSIAIVGAGPAGLAAAEVLAPHADVHVFEAKPSPGRKSLLAGRSGLNLSRAESLPEFLERLGAARDFLAAALAAFPPEAVRAIRLICDDRSRRGDFVITSTGVEGNAVYAMSAQIGGSVCGESRPAAGVSAGRAADRPAAACPFDRSTAPESGARAPPR
ncbi:MAG: NAD(P)/FAD-dependent oxidoreductase [Pseudomonadales bacterium]|nr:NAD(P)/FAD-dependent oxidoreductase [Pseudomonadales bacterium]